MNLDTTEVMSDVSPLTEQEYSEIFQRSTFYSEYNDVDDIRIGSHVLPEAKLLSYRYYRCIHCNAQVYFSPEVSSDELRYQLGKLISYNCNSKTFK